VLRRASTGHSLCTGRNLEHVDVALIDRAERELGMPAYVLTDWPVMQALTRAADRGVAIRIYLDGTQLAEREQAKVFNDLAESRKIQYAWLMRQSAANWSPVLKSLLAGNLQGIFPNLNQVRRKACS
jgi:phosphatidylserine/phosphatidylglycerophosphate/cardiolipin synthase-like enzyme